MTDRTHEEPGREELYYLEKQRPTNMAFQMHRTRGSGSDREDPGTSHVGCEHEAEVEKLREILREIRETGNNSLLIHEIESKHGEQMEELRRYFEKKCAELEKSFSEDVFSQKSRKASESDFGDEFEGDGIEKEDLIEKYRTYLEEEEDGGGDNEKNARFLKIVTEIANRHAEELNFQRTKHQKEVANIRKRHLVELNLVQDELNQLRKTAESEKEVLINNYESRLQEVAAEERRMMATELEREFESKVKQEIKKLGDLLLAESKAQEKDSSILEESCMEKLSEYQTESALRRIEIEKELERRNEEKFRKELEEEKIRIAQHYRDLNEAALRRFNEEQENLIRSHSDIVRRLIQEHEERITELKRTHKQDLERFHCDEGTKLAMEFRKKEKKFENELSSLKSTYEDELFQLKKCCQDTLNEQVCLAKADAFNILQKQIQDYLNGDDDDSLEEVKELGERFAGKYRREIEELKKRHHGEVTRIRTEYEEKIRRRYSTGSLPKKSVERMEMRTDDDKLLILRERDALQEMVASLRHVLSELIRYVGSCENELNSTIVADYSADEPTMYKSLRLETSDLNETECSSFLSKRVHFAADQSSISELNDSRALNTSMQVRTELDRCLRQLKSDASHLLALSNPARKQDENLCELLEKMEKEKERLLEKVASVEDMQRELKTDINNTKGKLAELERNREVVSEGYGEEIVNAHKQETFIRLKEKAKALMGPHCTQSSDILHVLDEICKEGDRLQDEARREKHDLQQQVAAADKQLRATRKFLEEQAAEREVERDDYTNEIKRLTEVLRVRERDKSLQDRMNEEVKPRRKLKRTIDALENQLRDVNERLAECEQTKGEIETKLKDAVEKIWTLREIIRDLEGQVATVSEKNSDLLCRVEELEQGLEEQEKINRGLVEELENLRTQTRDEHEEHVKSLEDELAVLRQAAERLSTEAMTQMRVSLREIELALTKKTKDLEQLHASSANVSCSSPCSEDISVCERLDTTGCPTPDEMQEVEKIGLPLEEMDRIQEKLARHTRAEEVAIKTVRDLQLQLKNNRKAFEEVQIERDVLLERADTYLQENSRLKVRLDEQRCNAGIIQKQLSADLESQIKRLEYDIEKLNELCIQKDKQIRDMNIILEQTTKSLKLREAEALNKSNEENEIITNLKTELFNALEEKRKLEETVAKMKESLHGTVSVPVLMETMLEEKNAEIDRLEKEVARLSKQRAASSLIKTSTDSADSSKSLKRVKFTEPDSFVQVISPILPQDQSVVRCAYDSFADLGLSSQKLRKSQNWATTPESLSSIGPLQLSPRGADSHNQWNNSHALLMSSPKHDVKTEIETLRRELSEKTEKIRMYECERTGMDAEIDEIRVELKSTMDAVEHDKSLYKQEFEKMLENESKLRSELESRRREISERLLEIDTLKRKLAEVNLELETAKSEYQKLEGESAAKDDEINKLHKNAESLLMTMETLKRNHLEEVEELQSKLNFEHNRVESVLEELKILEVKKIEIEEEFLSLKEDYNEKLNSQETTVANLRIEVEELNRKNKELMENYEKLEAQMDVTLTEADKLSKDLTDELDTVKNENGKLRKDYLSLKNDLDSCIVKISEKVEGEAQTSVETGEKDCQTETAGRMEVNEEVNAFQSSLDKLRTEMNSWEQRMDEKELEREELLSYAALVRTLISCILDNLDDHFYELQTYRKKVMECSVDDLTDKVQKELLLSAKLDNKLLSKLQTEKSEELEDGESTLIQDADGDSSLSRKKQNLANVTVKLYELETNLQDMELRNKEFEEQIAVLKREKVEEKKRADGLQGLVRLLEEGLAKERLMLAEEKGRCEEDAKIMEVMRMNFELFVEKVDELERALQSERQHRLALEKMLKSPGGNQDVANASELLSQLEVERQKCATLTANMEKERKKNQELRIQLEQEKLERVTEKDLQKLLNKDLALLQEQKANLESQLSHAKEILRSRQAEIAALKRKVSLQEIDIKALTISSESQQDKEAEISMMAEKVNCLEKELEFYREKVQSLSEKSESISAPLMMKMKILDNCVEQHVQESNEMGEAVLHLTQETEQMRTLIKKIEERTENGALSNSSDDTIIADVEAERKRWSTEKERLTSDLEKARCDYDVLKKDSMEVFRNNEALRMEIKKLKKEMEVLRQEAAHIDEKQIGIPEDRVLHLFGKYMRTEAYRKALAHQKLYLTSVVKGYEREEDALARLHRGGSSSRRREVRRRQVRSRRRTFKMVALVIIAIKRMQFIVARWRVCRIVAFNALMGRDSDDRTSANKENEPRKHSSGLRGPIDPLRYQTHNFLRQQTNVLGTPPCRDPDSRPKLLDRRRTNENIERLGYLHKNLALPHPP
ncbi:UNVERIFIED_CONTAM: hypothetical protein PYX00_003164 [Menopon gallinae]|uniref:Pericentrin/AKAP-450 centrosomal targeting domain-containing protein n=1 Tax=Menopon gallinae TaxID=328185 RepID=A0AAW2I0I0_9NEOP